MKKLAIILILFTACQKEPINCWDCVYYHYKTIPWGGRTISHRIENNITGSETFCDKTGEEMELIMTEYWRQEEYSNQMGLGGINRYYMDCAKK